MALNPSPNFNPVSPIPNNPFFSAETWAISSPQGSFIKGGGLLVDPITGYLIATSGSNPPGTVTSVTAGVGIATTPAGGITGSGSVQLAPVGGSLVPGSYNYASVQVDIYGRVVVAQSSVTPIQSVSGLNPIYVTGAAPSVTVGINLGDTTQVGAVQLRDDCNTPSITLALTANQGFVLQQQINVLSSVLGNQFLAGTLNASTGDVVTATIAGNLAGITAGNPLPAPSLGNTGADVIVATGGTYSPPGGGGPYVTVAGDKFISDGTSWVFLPVGFRAPYATTTSSGVVRLATVVETQAFADFTLAVTPGTLGTLTATTTERGFVELATDAETVSLAINDRAVTPANLGALQASPTQRGLVQLVNLLGSGSTTQAPTAALLDQVSGNMIPKTIIDANGDLIVGAGPDTPAILSKGPNGSILTVDVTKPLGIGWSVPDAQDTVPVGGILWYTSNDPAKLPVGYVVCDGDLYSALPEISPGIPNPFHDLFTVIGYTFGGAGDDFRVPDLRAQFIRGFDPSGAIDTGRVFGSAQGDAFKQHNHTTADHTHTTADHTHTTDAHNHTSPPHTHTSNPHTHTNQPHGHGLPPISTANVVGDDNGLYKGNRNQGFANPTLGIGQNWVAANNTIIVDDATNTNQNTTVSINNTTVVVNDANVTVNNANVTVNNAPTVAPVPDETRPRNVALLPIIKYTNDF